jgi:leucyl/phenylalanyl-tRNA--protein transferase
MPLYALDSRLWFPPVEEADDDGLLAIGGDLSAQRLLLAYRQGIFPWYDGDLPLWWSPAPRFVLYPHALNISKSMQVLLKRNSFTVTTNQAFEQVIDHCSAIKRKDQDGTWISGEVARAYTQLHTMGYAHSVEAWKDGQLAGGLYGIRMGQLFFGESMFSLQPNASKYAFITYVQQLQQQGVQLIDCQVYTPHLESLGATMISRQAFKQALQQWL